MKNLIQIKLKSKFTLFSGYVSFISALLFIGIIIYSVMQEYNSKHVEEALLLIFLGCLVLLVFLLQYLISTKFWKYKISEYESIILDNKLLEEKIKNRKLKMELGETKP